MALQKRNNGIGESCGVAKRSLSSMTLHADVPISVWRREISYDNGGGVISNDVENEVISISGSVALAKRSISISISWRIGISQPA